MARIELSEEQRAVLRDEHRLPLKTSINGKDYTPKRVLGCGFKGVVWEVSDEFGRRRAVKLAISEDYVARSYLLELTRAAKLEEYPEFAHFIDAGPAQLSPDPLPGVSFVGFVEEFVDGVTLEEFLEKQPIAVTVPFFVAYVRALSSALNALSREGLRHDDLHCRNVMIANPGRADLFTEYKIKIIDTGSLKTADTPLRKTMENIPIDDHHQFVGHLVRIWNTIYQKRRLSLRDRRFLSYSTALLKSMVDDDLTVALRDPRQIVQQFELAQTRASSERAGTSTDLS